MYENILFEKKDGVAYLTLNRPDQLNALNSAVLKELDDALAAIDGDAEIRVLVVRGAGEKALAAGADITEMQSMEAEAGMAFGAFGQKVFAKIQISCTECQRRFTYHTCPRLRKFPFRKLRIIVKQEFAGHQFKDRISQKFQTFITLILWQMLFVGIRAVNHRLCKQGKVIKFVTNLSF